MRQGQNHIVPRLLIYSFEVNVPGTIGILRCNRVVKIGFRVYNDFMLIFPPEQFISGIGVGKQTKGLTRLHIAGRRVGTGVQPFVFRPASKTVGTIQLKDVFFRVVMGGNGDVFSCLRRINGIKKSVTAIFLFFHFRSIRTPGIMAITPVQESVMFINRCLKLYFLQWPVRSFPGFIGHLTPMTMCLIQKQFTLLGIINRCKGKLPAFLNRCGIKRVTHFIKIIGGLLNNRQHVALIQGRSIV